jgi:hypothetical protein
MPQARAKNHLFRAPSAHEIHCFSKDRPPTTDYNSDQDKTHNMYLRRNQQLRQSPSRRSSYDTPIGSITRNDEDHPRVHPLSPNGSRKANDKSHQNQAVDLLGDDTHTYSVIRPSKLSAGRYNRESD